MPTLRMAMAQINATVGDVASNTARIMRALDDARAASAHVVSFPELATTGYPPEDLLFHPRFVNENLAAIKQITAATTGITAVVGFVDQDQYGRLYNAAAICHDGSRMDVYHKCHLPNYGVFDEQRYFTPGKRAPLYTLGTVRIGVNICEDIWVDDGPTLAQAAAGAQVTVNINASPFHMGKHAERERMLTARARNTGSFICYNNLVGGQDELVFDGRGVIVTPDGTVTHRANAFEEDLLITDLTLPELSVHEGDAPDVVFLCDQLPEMAAPLPETAPPPPAEADDEIADVHSALTLGIRDYLGKNGFTKVVIGLSGGIDSSLVAALAVEALGPDQVTCVYMPSRYSSEASTKDASAQAERLGVKLLEFSIEEAFSTYLSILSETFAGQPLNETEENLQPRIRGTLLMALSNKFGWLVLTTGNKSEMAVGYATLYGDMAGGFAVIKDLPKWLVYKVSEYINRSTGREMIPHDIITKAPTAELREDQLDTDSLPPYDVLDPILAAYVEQSLPLDQIVDLGYDPDTVRRIIRMVDMAEYKRRQAPPGIRITPRAFGRDRRMPITNRFRE
ncbi:MAG: NAD+ synthase [Leptospirillia bacterium]